mmetsp:Transcript_27918/g.90091  ORF Transcript_27918/g.90091 Transcript_27918/m.90091 type:complete len:223 (+) Transcript_27918:2440-3108(+)
MWRSSADSASNSSRDASVFDSISSAIKPSFSWSQRNRRARAGSMIVATLEYTPPGTLPARADQELISVCLCAVDVNRDSSTDSEYRTKSTNSRGRRATISCSTCVSDSAKWLRNGCRSSGSRNRCNTRFTVLVRRPSTSDDRPACRQLRTKSSSSRTPHGTSARPCSLTAPISASITAPCTADRMLGPQCAYRECSSLAAKSRWSAQADTCSHTAASARLAR